MTLHQELAAAWQARGLTVLDCRPASGHNRRPNPTLVVVRQGNTTASYHVFAWRATHEGKGRRNDNLRVQATGFGDGNSPYLVNRATVAVGYSEPHLVFFGFDAWNKRNPGGSSSVHVTRELIEEAAVNGLASGGDSWDPRIAFGASHAEALLPWLAARWAPKCISVKVRETESMGIDFRRVLVDPLSSRAANAVRVGDRLALFDEGGQNPDNFLWRVRQIDVLPMQLDSGIHRFRYSFTVQLSAQVTGGLEAP